MQTVTFGQLRPVFSRTGRTELGPMFYVTRSDAFKLKKWNICKWEDRGNALRMVSDDINPLRAAGMLNISIILVGDLEPDLPPELQEERDKWWIADSKKVNERLLLLNAAGNFCAKVITAARQGFLKTTKGQPNLKILRLLPA